MVLEDFMFVDVVCRSEGKKGEWDEVGRKARVCQDEVTCPETLSQVTLDQGFVALRHNFWIRPTGKEGEPRKVRLATRDSPRPFLDLVRSHSRWISFVRVNNNPSIASISRIGENASKLFNSLLRGANSNRLSMDDIDNEVRRVFSWTDTDRVYLGTSDDEVCLLGLASRVSQAAYGIRVIWSSWEGLSVSGTIITCFAQKYLGRFRTVPNHGFPSSFFAHVLVHVSADSRI